jgi:hypothetical protein
MRRPLIITLTAILVGLLPASSSGGLAAAVASTAGRAGSPARSLPGLSRVADAMDAGSTWSNAAAVEGLPALTAAGAGASITQVSCPSPGNCAAIGQY